MCGPGYLLGQIAKKRPDLELVGMDIDPGNVIHGKRSYPRISFKEGDIRKWLSPSRFTTVLCTGAMHHLPYDKQEGAIAKIAETMQIDGIAIISDCYIDPYKDEVGRRLAAARLGYEYLRFALQREAPDDVARETVTILGDDVLGAEYKMSYKERKRLLDRHFSSIRTIKTWPKGPLGTYGDYIHVCTRPV